jgi:EAL domain-containing protein (putative c-di-GMP-specific phosphodiesterase class I)
MRSITASDDFGSGYSSPSYLRRLPVDAIKIDASLIDEIERFTEDRLIVHHTIALAHALGLRVIAEHTERKEQLVELMGFECNEGQGHLISAPVDEATATDMVITRWFAESIAQ